MDDQKIIELYFARNEQAIVETSSKYGRYCYSIAYNILHDSMSCEESLNDTWLKTWNSIPPKRPNHFQLYLAKIVRNIAFDCTRSKLTLKRGEGELNLVLDELEYCLPANTTSADEFYKKELVQLLNEFLKGLPAKESNVFVRRYFYVEDVETIAKRYQLKTNHVYVTLSRTRAKLRKYLEKAGYFS